MPVTEKFTPSISFDTRKGRIRIYKQTIHALGDPSFVVLIINPEEHTIGIKCSTEDDKLAHRIKHNTANSRNCYEIYSKSLIAALSKVCPDWIKGASYKLSGKMIHTEKMACFDMADAILLNSEGTT